MLFRRIKTNKRKNTQHVWASDFTEILEMMEGETPTECYDSYGDMMDAASDSDFNRRFHGDKKFGADFDSAKRLLTRGYQPKEMKGAFADFDTQFEATEDVIKMNEEGYDFDIPSLLSGDDDVWFDRQKKGDAPSIHIVYEGCSGAATDAMNFYIQSAVVNKLAEILSEEAHIKVSATYSNSRLGKWLDGKDKGKEITMAMYVTMKDYDEAVDLRSLGGASHPSFFRRVMFNVWENRDGRMFGNKTGLNYGYGCASSTKECGVTDEMENELFESDIVLHLPAPGNGQYNNVERAVALCKEKLAEVNAQKV